MKLNAEVDSTQLKEETEAGSFDKFALTEGTISKLNERGIEYLFPVQAKTFTPIYKGKDAVVKARTGTGKTMAFALPTIENLLKKPGKLKRPARAPRVLVLAPTRELAKQICDDFASVSSLTCVSVYGGVPIDPQRDRLQAGCDVVAGTPGRVNDLVERMVLNLSKIKFMILDEVDRMLDMGFSEQVEQVMSHAYEGERKPQTLLFSATIPDWVPKTAAKYMNNDNKIEIDLIGRQATRTSTTVQHLAIKCSYQNRASVLGDVLSVYSGRHGRAMVFCSTKRDADHLAVSPDIKQDVHVMHGDIPQVKRDLVLKGFREGKYQVLITTDVAARGLDIPEVDLVVQTAPPSDVDSYIHRSGRTGRAGKTGTCMCFYKHQEEGDLKYVEKQAGITFKRVGAPTQGDIITSAAEDSCRALDTVPVETLDKFRESAQRLIDERGAVEALSAALAVMSGSTEIKLRSLITSKEGFVTYEMSTQSTIHAKGFIFKKLSSVIGTDSDKVQCVRLLKSRQGAVFDLPVELANYLDDHWADTEFYQLKRCEELPEIEEPPQGGGGGGYTGGGGRGGFNPSGGKGGFKRSFNGSSNGDFKRFEGGSRGRGRGGRGRGKF